MNRVVHKLKLAIPASSMEHDFSDSGTTVEQLKNKQTHNTWVQPTVIREGVLCWISDHYLTL